MKQRNNRANGLYLTGPGRTGPVPLLLSTLCPTGTRQVCVHTALVPLSPHPTGTSRPLGWGEMPLNNQDTPAPAMCRNSVPTPRPPCAYSVYPLSKTPIFRSPRSDSPNFHLGWGELQPNNQDTPLTQPQLETEFPRAEPPPKSCMEYSFGGESGDLGVVAPREVFPPAGTGGETRTCPWRSQILD
jgi:hypothetical protein